MASMAVNAECMYTTFSEDQVIYRTKPGCEPTAAPSPRVRVNRTPTRTPTLPPTIMTIPPTISPTMAPTFPCRDTDDHCEAIAVNGKAYPVCEYLQKLKIENKKKFDLKCTEKKFKTLVPDKADACPYLEETPYIKATEDHCDEAGNYVGYHDSKGRAVIEINYSEICAQTCGVCDRKESN